MEWVVVGLASFDAWSQSMEDIALRIQVLEWLVSLQDGGPPEDADFDAFRETWSVTVPRTTVTAEYIVAPFLDPPAIAFRRFY